MHAQEVKLRACLSGEIMKQKIIEIAKSMGIDEIGFTSVMDYSYLDEFLRRRERMGYSCELEEQDISKRLDVRNIFPECRSIIAIAVPYGAGYKKPISDSEGLLSISSYGEDYHKKVRNILSDIAEEIEKLIDFKYKICVDTSPLIDREICKNAGIGSYGKNTLLINEKYGSFINLGYLLTDLELECDNKNGNDDICGSCRICVKNCPNSAIFEDGGINARRCISYLTQTKKEIPSEYIKNMKNQIYGCDVCQLVCPKNRCNSEKHSEIDYNSLMIDLHELLQMSNDEFKNKYGHMAGSWRGKNVWKRNALIAAGNLKIISMIDLVENELSNPSEIIRVYAGLCMDKLRECGIRDGR